MRGIGVDRELARQVPDNPIVQYNLACSLALLGHKDAAMDSLEEAVSLGYADADGSTQVQAYCTFHEMGDDAWMRLALSLARVAGASTSTLM